MSTDWQADVAEFMRAMGQTVRELPIGSLEEGEADLAYDLIREEIEVELVLARGDAVATADAVADGIYVLLGLLNRMGIRLQPIWDEVHRTNMEKLDGPIREDGKKMKPPGWKAPDIEGCLRAQGWQGGK